MESILQHYISQGYTPRSPLHWPKGFMIRLRIHQLLAQRGLSAYALSQGAKVSYPTAYRMSRPGARFGRLHADTLDRLCTFFRVQPGTMLEWVPDRRRNGARVSRRR